MGPWRRKSLGLGIRFRYNRALEGTFFFEGNAVPRTGNWSPPSGRGSLQQITYRLLSELPSWAEKATLMLLDPWRFAKIP